LSGDGVTARSAQSRHRELVQLRILLARAEPEAARLGRAYRGRPLRENGDRQLLLFRRPARLRDVSLRLSGRRLGRGRRALIYGPCAAMNHSVVTTGAR